jgi:hypothetical protein
MLIETWKGCFSSRHNCDKANNHDNKWSVPDGTPTLNILNEPQDEGGEDAKKRILPLQTARQPFSDSNQTFVFSQQPFPTV